MSAVPVRPEWGQSAYNDDKPRVYHGAPVAGAVCPCGVMQAVGDDADDCDLCETFWCSSCERWTTWETGHADCDLCDECCVADGFPCLGSDPAGGAA